MSTYQVKLVRHETIAEGTMAFHFEKPAQFQFQAGQSVDITLIDPPETDAEGNKRAFSIASGPFEKELTVATRMRDTAFKRVLKNLAPGSSVGMDGPFGSFTLHKNTARPAVFLAGGIGITPFSSIVRQAAYEHLPHRLFLFYANNRPEDAAFLAQLQQLQASNPNYHLIATMADMPRSKQPWSGETGFIRAEMIQRTIGDLKGPIYYMAGPPAMVAAMRRMLEEAGVDPDDIRTEEFSGY